LHWDPGVQLYALHGNHANGIVLHEPISKTKAFRAAKYFHSVRFGTFLQQRPDLDPNRITGGDREIITLDATEDSNL
jgi:hypothetical protein